MASGEEDGGGGGGGIELDGGSLFEGMVLFSPSDLSSSPPPLNPPLPPSPPSKSSSSQQPPPLDADLFSDLNLTLQSQSQSNSSELSQQPPPPSRQISRKKKKAVRIGYGRDSSSSFQDDDSPQIQPPPIITPQEQHDDDTKESTEITIHQDDENHIIKQEEDHPTKEQPSEQELTEINDTPTIAHEEEEEEGPPPEQEDPVSLEKLDLIKSRISENLDRFRRKAALVFAERKELGQRRRKATENLNSASVRFKELERELEEACEAEDFERAERLSENLKEMEKEKDGLVGQMKEAELECDAVDFKMQEVLELQIVAEEEGVALLEQFAKDAADYADLVLRNTEEVSSKELQEWQTSMELLEVRKIEMDIESHIVSEARSGLDDSIEHLVEDDRKEVEVLRRRRSALATELDELLALVRLKEAEIAENDSQILDIEEKITSVISEFHERQSSVDVKHDNLQEALSKIEAEGDALSIKKKEIDEFISLAEQKTSKLKELASVSLDEARTCQDLVGLRKRLASSILKSREDKVELAKTEETILEESQILRRQINSARTTLQELSSTRASIQQEIASVKQKIDFIDKRGPELEAEKKVAAAARNFKEAGRIAAEAKTLTIEKEGLQNKSEKATLDLQKLEEDIKDTVDKIQESESLILLKEKEAAAAGCKRLWLVAAAARAERSAALAIGDVGEGDMLLKEAEAAESKAKELQETFDLESEEYGKPVEHFYYIELITNFAGQHLAEMASSFDVPPAVGSQQ